MGLDPAIVCLVIVAAMFVRLRLSPVDADLVFLTGLIALVTLGLVPFEDALAGFASNTVLTLAGLLVVTTALERTGVLSGIVAYLSRWASTQFGVLIFMATTVAPMSAFMNNTPVVDVFIRLLRSWCRRHRVAPGEVLLPLSFLAILGGLCTLIGTSTTLLISGLMVQEGMRPLGFFEIGRVGLPCALIGVLYVCFPGRYILRKLLARDGAMAAGYREFIVEVEIAKDCPAVGHALNLWAKRPEFGVVRAKLQGQLQTEAPFQGKLSAGDVITCVGSRESIVELLGERGITPAATRELRQVYPIDEFSLVQVTLSGSSPVVGKLIRESEFQTRYGGVIVAASFSADAKIYSSRFVRLKPGEPILVLAPESLEKQHGRSSEFAVVSAIPGARAPRHGRRWPAAILGSLLLGILVLTAVTETSHPFLSATSIPVLLCAVLLIGFRCIDTEDARSALAIPLVVTIACSIGIGAAFRFSGAGRLIADGVEYVAPGGDPITLMICLYVLATVLTEVVSNAAVAAALFPVAVELADSCECSPIPFIIAVAVAASASFLTPLGYQTNMMVQEPGRYENRHYFLYGLPLTVLVGLCAVLLIPRFWPLYC